MNKLLVSLAFLPLFTVQAATSVQWAGARSSVYGANPFPEDSSWAAINRNIATATEAQAPTAIWIVGHLDSDNGSCYLEFDRPTSLKKGPLNVTFNSDKPGWIPDLNDHEATLDYFDTAGVKVLLQVEPGLADMDTLIDIVMKKYKHHPCVVGFGFDIEWYGAKDDASVNGGGVVSNKVTKALASAWDKKLKSFNPSYTLFLKHWLTGYLAETSSDVVDGVLYINDSQNFTADGGLSAMQTEFSGWASYFNPSPVGFQYGYPNDTTWWTKMSDPVGEISKGIQSTLDTQKSSQKLGMFWVDFTLQNKAVSYLWKNNGSGVKEPVSSKLYQPEVRVNGRIISCNQTMKSLQIFSPSGKLVKQVDGMVHSVELEKSHAAGVYLIQGESLSDQRFTSQIVIQ